MNDVREAAIEFFNSQVKVLDEEGQKLDTRVSLVVFSNEPEIILFNEPSANMCTLDNQGYVPHGWTALCDAIGMAIDRIKADLEDWNEENVSHLFVIVTDGGENHSTHFNSQTISKLTAELQETGRWTFAWMSANQNIEDLAAQYNIPRENMMSFVATDHGMARATSTTERGLRTYYSSVSGSAGSVSNFYNGAEEVKSDISVNV